MSARNRQAEPRSPEPAARLSLTLVHGLWIDSWETALAALTTATQSGTLTATEAAVHKAAIAAERAAVTEQLALLLGPAL